LPLGVTHTDGGTRWRAPTKKHKSASSSRLNTGEILR
jgi:hypothetical protein